MKILQIHNRYRFPGGEDRAADAEAELLMENGHEVWRLGEDSRSLRTPWAKLGMLVRMPWSEAARGAAASLLDEFRPDIVHVHNFFPLLTPSVYEPCCKRSIPVVQALHNYRLICPGGLLLRQGRLCEECVGKSPWRGVAHGCWHGRLPTVAVARMLKLHRRLGTWQREVARFVAPSEFTRDLHVRGGLPAEKIAVLSPFVPDPGSVLEGKREGALYVGRLSEEKGTRVLLEAWEQVDLPLTIAGDGPLAPWVRRRAKMGVRILGRINAGEVAAEISRAAFMVLPSLCYETFGLAAAEAFAGGAAVVASRQGSLIELVKEGETGLLAAPGDPGDLAAAVMRAARSPLETAAMGRLGRRLWEERFSPQQGYLRLFGLYRELIGAG